jgi:hypothetical protein
MLMDRSSVMIYSRSTTAAARAYRQRAMLLPARRMLPERADVLRPAAGAAAAINATRGAAVSFTQKYRCAFSGSTNTW